jgi:hypothetical protein
VVTEPICARCGQEAGGADLPLTWVTSLENGHRVVYCDRCVRENVRSIEGKLDSAWW